MGCELIVLLACGVRNSVNTSNFVFQTEIFFLGFCGNIWSVEPDYVFLFYCYSIGRFKPRSKLPLFWSSWPLLTGVRLLLDLGLRPLGVGSDMLSVGPQQGGFSGCQSQPYVGHSFFSFYFFFLSGPLSYLFCPFLYRQWGEVFKTVPGGLRVIYSSV